MEDLSDAVELLASGTYQGQRRTSPSPAYVDGVLQSYITTPIQNIVGSFQPATGLTVQRLPEGKRNRETLEGFTTVELKTAQGSGVPDLVYIDGGTFEVESVKRWDKLGGYWQVVLTRAPGT